MSTGLELHLRHRRTSVDVFTHTVRPRVAPGPPPHPGPSTDDGSIPPARVGPRPWERCGMVPVFTANRLTSLASSFAPAASPRLRRRPSPWPPRRHAKPASESSVLPLLAARALHPGPYPPDLSRCHAYGAFALVPLVCRLVSLAGPGPSGSTEPSRLCQRCFHPLRRLPDRTALSTYRAAATTRRGGLAPPSVPSASRRTSASWRTAPGRKKRWPASRSRWCGAVRCSRGAAA